MEFKEENEEKNNQEIESEEEIEESENTPNKFSDWLQDNLRIIISVLIVVLIAGGIYSYSNRTESPQEKTLEVAQNIEEPADLDQEKLSDSDQEKTEVAKQAEKEQTEKEKVAEQKTVEEKKPTVSSENKENVSSVSTSQETEQSFIETASKGDSQTTLARVALAHYLEKNPDSSLKAEHKIYIEDYLRKNVSNGKGIFVGTSMEFSKSMISDAISRAKNLNENQINNLHKYVIRTPSLT
ncbi:MAG: hypothetical protein COZ85_02715 [Candidatus Moranbacteria bacterium CG_4_8_14_3_um_filter_34_16]|nr:MAG: hypothetical protein COT31_03760 [Candidatus Moranbacteria bacterium CG08_land_8_20_14_0_20_34_16]PIW94882.1 MAG: hypothetical protein COZ85_02715 [Candidatus Moranbacteria bacterium CG_4_8_14_3_um_filter_34_16]PJA89414.1 MAG: hypothetical protein CO138_00570 [Candidatus Moranbacteria bacterium CG_4_9_14_3_um_filter_33_15]